MSRRGEKLARAVRRAVDRHADQQGAGRYRAVIRRWGGPSSFDLDVVGLDQTLDAGDVTISQAVRAYDQDPGLEVDDVLVLVETDPGEYSAVAVESSVAVPGPVDVEALLEAIDALQDAIDALDGRLDALEATRTLRGIVDATSGTPTPSSGDGWTITDNGVGDYTINFTPEFGGVPTVNVTSRVGAGGVTIPRATLHPSTAATASAARVEGRRADTFAALDVEFHFTAIGPA